VNNASVERFRASAAQLGMDIDVREFPEETRTALDAAEAIGCDIAQIVKSLVFIADDEPVLVLTSGANRVEEGALAEHLEAEVVRKADADEVRQATGYAIGGTPPFGHGEPLRVVCDADLTVFDEVWAAAGHPRTVFPLSADDLLRVTAASVTTVDR
jgi:prolyl-tRNA editing enzyme YbaK/EbsC (Cys-tRNA(Pro) deacylase)